ncbi:MAG: PaaX family transcriptional regulator [Acidimicrobiia bacterium]|nr:PaaX family transcriptional regulator [Acidimicrobiia bacterium]MDH4307184.1 PaaX family transcriptional regulator [Acidimicrobiia bacterium]
MPAPDRTARSLVTDVVGLYIRPLDGWIAVADLLTLLEPLGVEHAAARTAISRMVKDGLLTRTVRGGQSGYALSSRALPSMERADRRILGYVRAARGDRWLLASYSIPESERRLRDRLRRTLVREGFGTSTRGVWILPLHHRDDAMATLEEEGFGGMIDFFEADPLTDDADLVARAWDLPRLARGAARLAATVDALIARWPDDRTDDRAAFVDYTSVVDLWRPLAFHDPGLPGVYLGHRHPIEDSFATARHRLEKAAHRHVGSVTGVEFTGSK